jgi:P27 family predicted phage terminase small subunit
MPADRRVVGVAARWRMSRRKTTEQKKLEGTNRKDREVAPVVAADVGAPLPPSCLDIAALEVWENLIPQLERRKIVAPTHLGILTAYCSAVAEMFDLIKLRQSGVMFLVDDESGKEDGSPLKKYPLSRELREARKEVRMLAAEIGITPAAMARVAPLAPPDERPGADPMAPKRPPRPRAEPAN